MRDEFPAGLGAAQAVPGPIFTFAAYLGPALGSKPKGVVGAVIALRAMSLPGFLIVIGVLPFRDRLPAMAPAQALMQGATAGVVGTLAAAFQSPSFNINISDLRDLRDLTLALACFVLLMARKAPTWLVVIVAAVGGVGLPLPGGECIWRACEAPRPLRLASTVRKSGVLGYTFPIMP